jgi:hypothetical protein
MPVEIKTEYSRIQVRSVTASAKFVGLRARYTCHKEQNSWWKLFHNTFRFPGALYCFNTANHRPKSQLFHRQGTEIWLSYSGIPMRKERRRNKPQHAMKRIKFPIHHQCPIPAAARLQGLWDRIPPAAWMSVSCEVSCCQVEHKAAGLPTATLRKIGHILKLRKKMNSEKRFLFCALQCLANLVRHLRNRLLRYGRVRITLKQILGKRDVNMWTEINCLTTRPNGTICN